MYESWCEDLYEKNEFAKNYSLFIGSFSNAKMAQDIMQREKPTHASSDEDFEESTRMVLEDRERYLNNKNNNVRASKKRKIRRQLLNREE